MTLDEEDEDEDGMDFEGGGDFRFWRFCRFDDYMNDRLFPNFVRTESGVLLQNFSSIRNYD